ncbi:hypothetical protein [Tabrizicola sp.]|jgi:chaperone modulatory protein CbpM|uniref:hypothetical protein n=1 Tax=Tabrizicola sp. TaxID=2005166 RepID=UPI0035B1A284
MTRYYSSTEVVALIDDLTEPRLTAFLRASIVEPVATPEGPGFRETDVARLQLLCDLDDSYGLPEESLKMVMGLIDQLNSMRGDMRALIRAVAGEPDEVRARIHHSIRGSRG